MAHCCAIVRRPIPSSVRVQDLSVQLSSGSSRTAGVGTDWDHCHCRFGRQGCSFRLVSRLHSDVRLAILRHHGNEPDPDAGSCVLAIPASTGCLAFQLLSFPSLTSRQKST